MFHHSPRFTYNGLTIVMSQPSRFDKQELMSGNAGIWFHEQCLRPGTNRWMTDIWDCDDFNRAGRNLLPGTKVVLCLGTRAQHELMRNDVTLNELRGSPIIKDGIIYISSYLPQDTHDVKSEYETNLNPHLNGTLNTEEDNYNEDANDSDDNEGNEKSRHGSTSRSNFRFWLQRDTKKALRIIQEGGLKTYHKPDYNIFPGCSEAIDFLRSFKDEHFYLDIETVIDLGVNCFGVSFDTTNTVMVIPFVRYDGSIAYDLPGSILRSICYAMARNTTVAHNGADFDFFVLPYRYRMPVGRNLYDTMLAHHRCFPEVEKSLGHCLSNLTDLPYHKDEGIFDPQTPALEQACWEYNGKDVYSMKILRMAIDEYASSVPGLNNSISQVNRAIRPYLITTLQGFRFREDKRAALVAYNDRLLTQYNRLIETGIGPAYMKYIRGKSDKSMPGSNPQCCRYFHDILGYPIQGYGKPSKKDGKRNPSLNEKNFLKLAAKFENPIIDLVLKYRGKAKESGSLGFLPWKTTD